MDIFWLTALFMLTSTNAGSLTVDHDLRIEWTFGQNSDILFEFYIPDVIMADYGWVGCGFKYEQDGNFMTKSDIVNLLFDQDVTDSYALSNGTPTPDESLGGTEDILDTFQSRTEEGFTVFYWTRLLDTGDIYDTVFVAGDSYKFLWAFGEVEDGEQKKHASSNRGIVDFVLENETATSFLNFITN